VKGLRLGQEAGVGVSGSLVHLCGSNSMSVIAVIDEQIGGDGQPDTVRPAWVGGVFFGGGGGGFEKGGQNSPPPPLQGLGSSSAGAPFPQQTPP